MNWKKLFKYLILFVLFSIIIYYSSFLNVKATSTSIYYFTRVVNSSGSGKSFGPFEIGETVTNEYNVGSNKADNFTFYLSNLSFSKGYHYVFEFDFVSTRFFGDSNTLTYLNNSSFSIGGVSNDTYFLNVTQKDTNTYHFLFSGEALTNSDTFSLRFDKNAADLYYTVNFKIDNLSITSTDDNRFASFDIQSSIDGLRAEQEKTNEKLDELNDNITDQSAPDTDSLGNAAGWLPAGPVDSLLNLPITFFTTLLGKLEATCSPIIVELPFVEEDLTLPCLSTLFSQLTGFNTFWSSFGLIAGVWCLYKYFIALYKWVEHALSFDEKESLGKWGGV